MDRRRYRYIEREAVFNRVKKSTVYLSREQINNILDEHEWCDLTFLFDIRDHGITVTVIDNDTECDVAIADLNGNAKQFYHSMIRKLSKKDVLEYIKEMLTSKKAV